jgi:hypothetical protein
MSTSVTYEDSDNICHTCRIMFVSGWRLRLPAASSLSGGVSKRQVPGHSDEALTPTGASMPIPILHFGDGVDAGISGKTSCDLDDRENLYSLRYANYAVQNRICCLPVFGHLVSIRSMTCVNRADRTTSRTVSDRL